jgi:hypothetical protein
LYIDIIEDTGVDEFAIGRAVQRDSAGQSDASHAGLLSKVSANMQHNSIETLLQGRRYIFMVLGDLRLGRSPGYEVLVQIGAGRQVILAFLSRAVEPQNRNSKRTIGAQLDRFLKESAETLRIAVRRQPHDLVFIGVEIEAQVQRHQGIQDANGIVGGNLAQLLELAVAKLEYSEALHLSHRVVHHHQALVPPRRKCGAGGVREMVTYRLNLLGAKIGEEAMHLPDQRFLRKHALVELRGIWIERVELAVGRIVKAVSELGHILDAETRLAQTKLNGVDRKIAGVLLAAEAFLCRSSNELPVNYESRGRIVTLRDAVLPRVQARPMFLLERRRFF